MKKVLGICLLSLLLPACAHHRDVRQSEDGVHKVVVQSESIEQGARAALSQANHYCGQRDQQAVVVSEEQKYSGDLDEKTYKNAKVASQAAKAAGVAVWVFSGDKKSQDAGGAVAIGAGVVDASLGKGYAVEMKFKCVAPT